MKFYFLLVGLLAWAPVFAAESVTSVRNPNFSATYFGTYRIPSVLNGQTYQQGNRTYPAMHNTLFLNYNLNQTQFVGLVVGLELRPVMMNDSYLYNPAVRVGDRRLISNDTVRLSADLRVLMPLNDEAKTQKLITAVVSQDYLTIRPYQSNFFLDSFVVFKWQFFNQNLNGLTFYGFNRTGLNYDMTEKFGLSLSTINQAFLDNRPTPSSLRFDNLRLGPGAYWNFPNFEFNTYLTFNMTEPRLNEATLLALLFARVI